MEEKLSENGFLHVCFLGLLVKDFDEEPQQLLSVLLHEFLRAKGTQEAMQILLLHSPSTNLVDCVKHLAVVGPLERDLKSELIEDSSSPKATHLFLNDSLLDSLLKTQ